MAKQCPRVAFRKDRGKIIAPPADFEKPEYIVSMTEDRHFLKIYRKQTKLPSNYQRSQCDHQYHNHTQQTNPLHPAEEPQNNNSHKTSGREPALSSQSR